MEDYTTCPRCDSYRTEAIDSYMDGERLEAVESWRCRDCGLQWEVHFDLTNPIIINIRNN